MTICFWLLKCRALNSVFSLFFHISIFAFQHFPFLVPFSGLFNIQPIQYSLPFFIVDGNWKKELWNGLCYNHIFRAWTSFGLDHHSSRQSTISSEKEFEIFLSLILFWLFCLFLTLYTSYFLLLKMHSLNNSFCRSYYEF